MAEPSAGPTLHDPILVALVAEVAETNARQQEAPERLRAYLVACAAPPGSSALALDGWPEHAGHPDLISPAAAGRREACSKDTITRRCEDKGIGRKYDGKHWQVSVTRMASRKAA